MLARIRNLKTKGTWTHIAALVAAMALSGTALAGPGGYKKATEGDDVVKDKMYPKKGKLELNGPNLGIIMNQSYLDTYIVNAGINYFPTEVWGFGAEFTYAMNSDRGERTCIENFYNKDPNNPPGAECGTDPTQGTVDSPKTRSNYGPAYVNIREYNYIFSANAIWNPIYGKEIFFLSAVGHFDLYVTGGGGMAFSTFYPQTTTLANGKDNRGGSFPADGSGNAPSGTGPDETDPATGKVMYGKEGRPLPIHQSNPVLQAGIGQKFHFAQRFNFKVELRDHLVLGTPGGFDMFFTLWGGLGMRF